MATITVRDVDDDVVRRLKKLADGNGRSLESELRHIFEQAIANDAEAMAEKRKAFLEHIARRKQQQGPAGDIPQTPSWMLIREDRDSDHGRL